MNNNYCEIHPQKTNEFICLSNHECKRIFCPQCFQIHLNNQQINKSIIINDFQQHFLKKFSILDDWNLDEQHKYFKKELMQYKQEFIEVFQKYEEQYDKLIKDSKQNVSKFFDCKKQLETLDINQLTTQSVEYFLQTINNFEIRLQNKIQNQIRLVFQNIQHNVGELFKETLKQLQEFVFHEDKNETQQPNIKIRKQKIFGINHGECFYQKDNNQEIRQGRYYFNNKVGEWNEVEGNQTKSGVYNELGIKTGFWKTTTINNKIISGGEYLSFKKNQNFIENFDQCLLEKEQKIGNWFEIIETKDNSQIIWEGKYENGIRNGKWIIKYRDDEKDEFTIIGGGSYNKKGEKQGKWIDINDKFFSKKHLVLWEGTYNNDVRVGNWVIKNTFVLSNKFIIIGSGDYDQNGMKQGFWQDINEESFQSLNPIVWHGMYKNGCKIGNWQIYWQNDDDILINIGGGLYNEKGQKTGFWQVVDEQLFSKYHQIIWEGNYTQDIRTNKWLLKQFHNEKAKEKPSANLFDTLKDQGLEFFSSLSKESSLQIGYGEYNEKGQKIGKWVEIDTQFTSFNQLIWEGFYDQNCRHGKWELKFRNNSDQPFQPIGGGEYSKNGKKCGEWIEVYDQRFSRHCLIFKQGSYQNDIKTGCWKILKKEDLNSKFEIIGGGFYNKGVQKGLWTIIHIQNYGAIVSEQVEFDHSGNLINTKEQIMIKKNHPITFWKK